MKLINVQIPCKNRSEEFDIFVIGDIHFGARNCAETPLKTTVKTIANNPNARWLGGADYFNAIKPQDIRRFDMDIMPDWMLEGDAETTRERLNDILAQEYKRGVELLSPIQDKCLGLIEGNHEYSIRKNYNQNIQKAFCDKLGVPNLTDQAVVRLRFNRNGAIATVIIYIRHGYGSGRSPGAEPTKLQRMLDEWECADICFSGHTHNFHIIPPKPVMGVPRSGRLSEELTQRYRWAANWGCWLYSHAVGASSYDSRACYPARPMVTVKAVIRPFARIYFKGKEIEQPHIELRQITL